MERRKPRKKEAESYRQIIETHRDVMSDEQMEVFLLLYERGDKGLVAAELGIEQGELEMIIEPLMPRQLERHERLNRQGRPYLKRLSHTAFVAILADYPALSEDEKGIVTAMIDAPNQVVAAQSLGMEYGEFVKLYLKMRRKHGF